MWTALGPRSTRSVPNGRIPEPASKTIRRSAPHTSRQVVLPPYSTVFGPGDGIEPRVPQQRTVIPSVVERACDGLGAKSKEPALRKRRSAPTCWHVKKLINVKVDASRSRALSRPGKAQGGEDSRNGRVHRITFSASVVFDDALPVHDGLKPRPIRPLGYPGHSDARANQFASSVLRSWRHTCPTSDRL